MSYAAEKLQHAIKMVREGCDNADEALKDISLSDTKKSTAVLHELTWSLANAVSSIEAALKSAEALLKESDTGERS